MKIKTYIEIMGATLLTVEEAEALPERLRAYGKWWWLQSPGFDLGYAATVGNDGSVHSNGDRITNVHTCVRPALEINLESSELEIGDTFIFCDKEFEIISDSLAFCMSDIGNHKFDAKHICDYESSDVKRYIENWFLYASEKEKEKEKEENTNSSTTETTLERIAKALERANELKEKELAVLERETSALEGICGILDYRLH